MKVLSIGNSYSANATTYLHQLAESCGIELMTANLYIGGCPLSTHYRNMMSGEKAYWLQLNGAMTNFKISMEEAILSDDWDVITLQQQSFRSTDYETFQPYLNELYDYVTTLCPKAKIAIHQTWGYKDGYEGLKHFESGSAMFAEVEKSYEKAADEIGADIMLKSGKAFELLKENGITEYFSDPIHANNGVGCYTLGLVWLKALTGADPYSVGEIYTQIPVTDEEKEVAKKVASML